MSTLLPENFETVSPTDSDARLALESSRILASRKLGKKTSVRIQLGDDDPTEGVVVPTRQRFRRRSQSTVATQAQDHLPDRVGLLHQVTDHDLW